MRHLVQAFHGLRRQATYAVTTVAILALGLTLTATTLAVVNAYLIRAMPYPNADRLYRAVYSRPGQREPSRVASIDWDALRDIVEVADYSAPGRYLIKEGDYPEQVSALLLAPQSLEALGVRAALGRSLVEADFDAAAEPLVMIGHRFWQHRFRSDPRILGTVLRAVQADSTEPPTSYRIVGILPPNFRYARGYSREPPDIALPLRTPRQAYMVRLRAGVPVKVAEHRITEAAKQVASTIPAGWPGVALESIREEYAREIQSLLIGVTVAAGFVLLIVTANVAVLALLRALKRQKEMSVRMALGASRRDLVRLLSIEMILLCAFALAAACGMSAIALHMLAPAIETALGLPAVGGVSAIQIDATVLLSIAAAGIVIVLVLSLVLAFAASRNPLIDGLGDGRSATDRPAMRRLRSTLVTAEIAASIALLIGCGLMVRSMINLLGTDLGFRTEHVVRARLQLPASYADPLSARQFYDRLNERMAALPDGVFTFSDFIPFWEPTTKTLEVEPGAPGSGRTIQVTETGAGPGYFGTLGIGIRAGRAFEEADREHADRIAIVSESLARQLVPDGNAIGQRIRLANQDADGAASIAWRTVIAVVADVRHTHRDRDFKDLYVPFQAGRLGGVFARTTQVPDRWHATFRTLVADIDREILVGELFPLALLASRELAAPTFLASVLTLFALLAALLAALGIYGVTAYAVGQREREVAIRLAIGATPRAVERLFLHGSIPMFAAGMAGGLIGATTISRAVETQLVGVERFDPWTLSIACLFLAAIGLTATWLPAHRVARQNPMQFLGR